VYVGHARDALDGHAAYLLRKLGSAIRTALAELRDDALVGVPDGALQERHRGRRVRPPLPAWKLRYLQQGL